MNVVHKEEKKKPIVWSLASVDAEWTQDIGDRLG